MNSQLAYDAHRTRIDDRHRRARERRSRRDVEPTIAIRRATAADRTTLERLAALDSAAAPTGEVLIAEVDGEPQAAVHVASGTAIADPFRPTAHLVELLTLRAQTLRGATVPRRRLAPRRRLGYGAA